MIAQPIAPSSSSSGSSIPTWGGGGTAHLIKLQRNSGGAATPRNIGLRFAHGKYVTFLDNDDLLITTALEQLYPIAERTGADVLHAQRFFQTYDERPKFDASTQISVMTWEAGPFVVQPEPVRYDVGERVVLFTQRRLLWNVWNKLFRRDFLAEHAIEFPIIKLVDDMMFCFQCFCLAKNYVRIPNIFNLYRIRNDSHSHNVESAEKFFVQSVGTIKEGTKLLDKFTDGMDFFHQHPEFKHLAINFFVQLHFYQTIDTCTRLPSHAVEPLIRKVFEDELDGNAPLMSYLFNAANIQRAQLAQANQMIGVLENRLAALKKNNGR